MIGNFGARVRESQGPPRLAFPIHDIEKKSAEIAVFRQVEFFLKE
jgi:hypothetical protein